jgi:endogenous inhibitor of DNA gyrase (YacG/DUF329 family)
MQTPKEYNEWFMQHFSLKQSLNIKCPNCTPDVEMVEKNPGMQLLSFPSQITIHCPQCSYTTNIYTN